MNTAPHITPSELVLSAIYFLQKKNGVTAGDITKFISDKRGCKQNLIKGEVKKALHRATREGYFSQERGLYRVKSSFEDNASNKNKMHKFRPQRKGMPENTAEYWECELEEKHSKNKILNGRFQCNVAALIENPPFSENFKKKFRSREGRSLFYNDSRESIPGNQFLICKMYRDDDADEDDDEDFLEEDDDDDDRDFFADDQFPKPEDAIKETCYRPRKRKACKPKKKIKSRSKSKSEKKCRGKKRNPSKRRKKASKRRRIMRCDKKLRDYDDESSDGNESDYEETKQKNAKKVRKYCDDKNDDDDDDDDKEEQFRNDETVNIGLDRKQRIDQNCKESRNEESNVKKRGIRSEDDNEDGYNDFNENFRESQKNDKAALKYQQTGKEENQKQSNNKQANQMKHEEFRKKNKADMTFDCSNDGSRNVKDSKNTSESEKPPSLTASDQLNPTLEGFVSNRRQYKKKPKRKCSAPFHPLKKENLCKGKNSSAVKTVKLRKP